MVNEYAVFISYLQDREIVKVAEDDDRFIMKHLAENLSLYAAKEVSEVAILDRDTQETVYLWRADGFGWISLI